jgi:DNA-binding NtrC family response regulator
VQTVSIPVLPTSPSVSRVRARTALLASCDSNFLQRLSVTLSGLRWQVHEAGTGAEAWAAAECFTPDAVIVDSWLPDLELEEFLKEFRASFPKVDLLTADGPNSQEGPRSPYRQELLYALRVSQDGDASVPKALPTAKVAESRTDQSGFDQSRFDQSRFDQSLTVPLRSEAVHFAERTSVRETNAGAERIGSPALAASERLPELVGNAPVMLEVSRRIRLVAPRSTPVLIEGPTGSGKELVAEALHRLSPRSRKPFVAINCAAIPEALLEAELFGHTRGAFTGAVQGRVGRIESADGGTLFLDEIGEMPLALQAKLLRFVESGELQRVGDNETLKVDVRIVAATHRPLAQHTQDGRFRADLYYRLAVFLIRTPALRDHAQDLPLLVDHFLERMGREEPMKRVDAGAMGKLAAHEWPGNVRELEHVLERAAILAGSEMQITAFEIDFGMTVN